MNVFLYLCRKIALTVILTRAGLGLDIVKLRKLSWAVLRLALLPCTCEIITVGIASHFILGFPWIWSLMLGLVIMNSFGFESNSETVAQKKKDTTFSKKSPESVWL